MRENWSVKVSNPDIVMLWAASVLCFFDFFRTGEITVPSMKAFDPRAHLSWGDVAIDSPKDPTMLKIKLKRSKTDQLGRGVDVYVGKTGCPLCPIGNQRAPGRPFLQVPEWPALNKAKIYTRNSESAVGLPYMSFAGHSFRIGTATAAAKAGIEDSTIQMLGRWSSSAFLVYIRTTSVFQLDTSGTRRRRH